MKTMKYYRDLYLKCDLLLYVDVFEKIRNNCIKNYGLRRSHYLTTPGLSWNAMLKMTKIELELIPDPDIYIYIYIYIYSLKKIQAASFLIFPIHIAKPTINI